MFCPTFHEASHPYARFSFTRYFLRFMPIHSSPSPPSASNVQYQSQKLRRPTDIIKIISPRISVHASFVSERLISCAPVSFHPFLVLRRSYQKMPTKWQRVFPSEKKFYQSHNVNCSHYSKKTPTTKILLIFYTKMLYVHVVYALALLSLNGPQKELKICMGPNIAPWQILGLYVTKLHGRFFVVSDIVQIIRRKTVNIPGSNPLSWVELHFTDAEKTFEIPLHLTSTCKSVYSSYPIYGV